MIYDVIIIGGGIVGFSTAWQLLKSQPDLKVAVLEKETTHAQHQTGHNSGVIHAGVYYTPGSMKAKFCYEGNLAVKAFCTQHQIPFKTPGKLIVATDEQEVIWLQNLKDRCLQNKLTVTDLDQKSLRETQPGINGLAAFHVAETGIVHWPTVCAKYAELFVSLGGDIHYQQQVRGIAEHAGGVTVNTQNNTWKAGYSIVCAGLYADRLLRSMGVKPNFKILPFRGEYYRLADRYNTYFKHLIYPVPNPDLPFLGVHFTPQMVGCITIGPSAVLALAREGYTWGHINLRDMIETLSYQPFWRLIMHNFKPTLHELKCSLFKQAYLAEVHKYFPQIKSTELMWYPAGVRAQALSNDGQLIDDFLFEQTHRTLHTCNAPSPAATSSLPIGEYIVKQFLDMMS